MVLGKFQVIKKPPAHNRAPKAFVLESIKLDYAYLQGDPFFSDGGRHGDD